MRLSWDEYFLKIISVVGERATCDRGRSGCVIVRDKRIVATGYVGSPPGQPHCDEVGHLFKNVIAKEGEIKQHCVRTIHAEQNAICQAARHGTSLAGATVYCKMEPCYVCAMMIVAVGVVRVVAAKQYQAAQDTRELFAAVGIELVVVEQSEEKYPV